MFSVASMKFRQKSHKALKVSGIDIPSFYDLQDCLQVPAMKKEKVRGNCREENKKHGTYKIRVTVKEPCMSSGKRREVRYSARWDINTIYITVRKTSTKRYKNIIVIAVLYITKKIKSFFSK